ncbi:MAG TPA: hypothetical protein VGJ53_12555 [Micromonosporaceae bacterium]
MTVGDLERDLRACLAARAAQPAPPAGDLSGAVIRRGHRILRRRAAGGAVALAAVTTLATSGIAQLDAGPAPPPKLSTLMAEPVLPPADPPSASRAAPIESPETLARENALAPRPLPVEVVTSERLVPTTGPTIDLKPVGPVTAAYGVSAGWLVTGGAPTAPTSLWFVRRTGARVRLLSDVDGLALSDDGTRVAWRKGGRLSLASITGDTLRNKVQTAAPAGSLPVAFAGRLVLLSRSRATSAGRTELGVWSGDRPDAVPAWRSEASASYGTLPDGRTIVARLADRPGTEGCVALLDASRTLSVQRRSCSLPLPAAGRGWVSPDGRWLVAIARSGRAVLVDLSTAFEATPTVCDAGPAPNGMAVWLDAHTLVHGGNGQELVRLRIEKLAARDAAGVEPIELSGLSNRERAQVVPHLGT